MIAETFETSQLPFEGTQASESLNTAFLRRVTQAETGALSTSEHGWSAGMQRSTQQRDSRQAVASNNCKQHNKRERKEERKGEEEKGVGEKSKNEERVGREGRKESN